MIKSYTDINQSNKLAEILPLESADNVIVSIGDREGVKTITMPKETFNILRTPFADIRNTIPCWSLAALLSVIPCSYGVYRHPYDDGLSLSLQISNCIEVVADNEMDACYEMIIRLNELNLL